MEDGLAYYLGNIDLNKRKVYIDPKTNKVQTEYSRSFGFGDKENPVEVLLPTVINGVLVDDKQAIDNYLKTGQHLGKFNKNQWLKDNPKSKEKDFYNFVDNYAKSIHNRQEKKYK